MACDESGAKGYANQNEAYDGEVGVFAGIMVSDSHLTAVEADFKTINTNRLPESYISPNWHPQSCRITFGFRIKASNHFADADDACPHNAGCDKSGRRVPHSVNRIRTALV
jgi:hypothetical protein